MKTITTIIKGFVVGGTMLVPGVSGGSMAMILGVYDRLISSVSSFFKDVKRNTLFLGTFVLAALVGIVLCASPLETLTDRYPKLILFFFIGAIAGGAPMMAKKAQIKRLDWRVLFYPLIGCLAVFLISLIPTGLFTTEGSGFFHVFMLFLAGLVVAVALILPGISTSHMLLTLGLYEGILKILKTRNPMEMLTLWPLIAGIGIGIILSTRLLESLLNGHPTASYLVVFGFLIGSVVDVFPGMPIGWEIPLCILLFAVGFAAIYFMSKLEAGKEAAN